MKRTVIAATLLIVILATGAGRAHANVPVGCSPSLYGTYFADVNGDRKADAIVVNHDRTTDQGNIYVRLSDGVRFGEAYPWLLVPFHGFGPADAAALGISWGPTLYFADVNGDKKADAVAITLTGVQVAISEGWRFRAPQKWTSGAFYGNRGTFVADVSADGRADVIVVNMTKTYPYTRIVTVAVAIGSGVSGAFVPQATTSAFSRDVHEFVDVTGDGKADAISWQGAIAHRVRPSIPFVFGVFLGFGAEEQWTAGAYYGTRGTFFADVTGDKLADAIVSNISGGVTVRRSNLSPPRGFSGNEPWAYDDFYGRVATYFADVTGDGQADAIALDSTRIRVRRSVPESASAVFGGMFFGNDGLWLSTPYYGDLFPACAISEVPKF